jgi:HEPN domain-containing protein
MFDLKDALAEAGVYNMSFEDLDDLLRKIRRQHLAEISPEIGVRELLKIGLENRWIIEREDGRFQIQVPVAA